MFVEVGLTRSKQHTIFCAHCHLEAARKPGIALFELRCPRPQPGGPLILGTWPSEHQAALEIGEFIEAKTLWATWDVIHLRRSGKTSGKLRLVSEGGDSHALKSV